MFFENYTEKVWGIHPSQISPDWGKQRVKGLSIMKVILNCLKLNKEKETSLIEEFMYPPHGPGQFYQNVAEKIISMGGKIFLNHKVNGFTFDNNEIKSVNAVDEDGNNVNFDAQAVFSSMPIKDLINSFDTNIPEDVKNIALNLQYRDFITVGLLVNKLKIDNLKDCWIYIQEKDVKLGRLQIFNNWSPYMVNNPDTQKFIGLEYFCNEDDEMWTMPDDDFIKMASAELEKIGIISQSDIADSVMIRVKKAYPAYFGVYKDFNKVKDYINTINNLYCIGRNGQHRYNNMDHSILSAFEAARSFINHSDKEIFWNVNTEKEYHEQK